MRGRGRRNKIVFISWSPDEGALVMVRATLLLKKPAARESLTLPLV